MEEESPYKNRSGGTWTDGAHVSDFRHYRFSNAFAVAGEPKHPVLLRKPAGVAIFGALGRAGSIHLSNVLSEYRANLLYVVEERKEETEALLQQWNVFNRQVISFNESHKVFNDDSVDAVIVATPTDSHEDIVTKALNAGKAVFCEKPIAETMEKTKRCYALAKEKGLPLLCAFNRRFDPGFFDLQTRTKKGEIGKPHVVKTCSRDSPLPTIEYLKISGGIFHDCAVHDIDMVCWILKEFPTQVYASAHANIPEIADIKDHDTVAIVLTFDSGAVGLIDLSRNAVYGYDQRVEVFGSKGMLESGNETPNRVTCYKPQGNTANPIFFSFPSRYADGYKGELTHFLNVVYGQEELIVKAEETMAVSRIATACEESLKKKAAVVLSW